MAKFIAYEWDDQSVRAISASAKGTEIAIHALVEKNLAPATEETPADLILENTVAGVLEEVGATRGQATAFSARRSQAEVRMLTFPNVPEHDLPDMVRIQAPQIFNAGTEGLLDFTPIGKLQDGQRYIAAAAISNETQVEVISSASTAGVTISNMTLHPFGTAAYVQKHAPFDDARLIVDILGVEAELTIAREGLAHLVRTIRLVPDAPDLTYIAAEVRRTLTAYENQPNGTDVKQIVIAGTTEIHKNLSDALAPLVSEAIVLFNPAEHATLDASVHKNLPDNSASFLGLFGLAQQLAEGSIPPIDFLHPTEPPKQTEKRDKVVRTGVYATLAVVAIIVAMLVQVANLKNSIAKIRPAAELQKALKEKFDQSNTQLGAIQTYESSSINWLDELALLSDTLPANPNDVIVDGFSGRSDNSRNRSADTPLGSIFLDMHLKNSSVFELLSTTLAEGTHQVESKGLTPDTTEDGLYTRRTQQTITILPPVNTQQTDGESGSKVTAPNPTSENSTSTSVNSTDADDETIETDVDQSGVTNDVDGE